MSLLMDTQTNRFWARVDFLATGEIVLHIPEECELPIRVLVSRGGRSTEYEPNCSEIPNNCEPQTENLFTDKDGDVWEWRGDAWYCTSGQDEPQTEQGKCPFDDEIPCEWVNCPNSKTDCAWK